MEVERNTSTFSNMKHASKDRLSPIERRKDRLPCCFFLGPPFPLSDHVIQLAPPTFINRESGKLTRALNFTVPLTRLLDRSGFAYFRCVEKVPHILLSIG